MTAVNPIPPNATPERDQRPYEPSMEEILASIRRIIADDQSLPGRQGNPLPVEEPRPEAREAEPELTTVHVLRPVPVPEMTPLPAGVVRAPPVQEDRDIPHPGRRDELESISATSGFPAHGTIAPQYATPEGPVPVRVDSPAATTTERYPSVDGDHIDEQTTHHASEDGSHQTRVDAPETAFRTDVSSVYDEPLGQHEPMAFEPVPVEPAPIEAAPLFSAATNQSITSAFNTLAASRLADNADELLPMSREMIRPLLKSWLDENLPSLVERLVRAEIERVARGGR